MNETRNILLGFEFGRTSSQICYYNRRVMKPCPCP